jgi:glucose/mannose-6-phosphate isomerase
MDLLDDLNTIKQRDTKQALMMAGGEAKLLSQPLEMFNFQEEGRQFSHIVVAGMGGSALAGDMCRDWLDLPVPFQVVKDYTLPQYVGPQTLVIACSFSGNTEETISAFNDAKTKGAHVVIAAGKGKLIELAQAENLPYVIMPYDGVTPRMFLTTNLRAFLQIFAAYSIIGQNIFEELSQTAQNLTNSVKNWHVTIPFKENVAKQLAWHCAGKTKIF